MIDGLLEEVALARRCVLIMVVHDTGLSPLRVALSLLSRQLRLLHAHVLDGFLVRW